MAAVLLTSFPNDTEAQIAASALRAAGIPCSLRLNPNGDALLGAMGIRTGPTDVFVEEMRFEEARRVLEN